MNQPNPHQIEERLRPEPVEPPDGLVERIKAEIPVRPHVVDWTSTSAEAGSPGLRRWAIAATLAVALIGTGLTLRSGGRALVPASFEPQTTPAVPSQPVEREAMSADLAMGAEPRDETAQSVAIPRNPVEAPIDASDPAAPQRRSPRQETPLARLAPVDQGISRDEVARAEGAHDRIASEQTVGDQTALYELQGRPGDMVLRSPGARALSMADAVPASPGMPRGQGPPAERERHAAPPSTGGTTEPNDQPYGDMFFRSWGVNPFIDTEDDNLSTFGLDVDTGSYTLARSYIERGHLPPPEAIRVEEFINYFDYRDSPPAGGDFAIHAEAAPSPFASGPRYQLLRFGLQGREIAVADRQPATLIFVVDVSGSMDRENRLILVKRSLSLLLDQLRPDDRVGLVVYGSAGRVLLEPTGDIEAIRSAIDRLRAEGSTNAEEGLLLGYRLAERYLRSGALHRIVLCSDGVANVGRTGPDSIMGRVRAATEQGIGLTTVGFGMGNYNDLLMEQLADTGDGSYAYVDDLDEARRIFVENLTGTLQTIAAEAKAQVEFNPAVVARYRLLGYENRDIADERFRDDTIDAGEIGAGHTVTALYEIKLHEGARRNAVLATLHLRYESKAAGQIVEVAESIRLGDAARSWEQSSNALRLSSLVAEFAEILRDSYWAKDGDLDDVFARAQRVSAEFAGDVEVAEFVSLVGRAARLGSRAAGE